MRGYLYPSNNSKNKIYNKLQKLFPINGKTFQGKPKLIAAPYVLQ